MTQTMSGHRRQLLSLSKEQQELKLKQLNSRVRWEKKKVKKTRSNLQVTTRLPNLTHLKVISSCLASHGLALSRSRLLVHST